MRGPSAHCGRVWQFVGLFRVWNRFFPAARLVQRLPGLLSAMETVVTVRRRPYGQNREGFPARLTSPAANADPAVPPIVRLPAPSAVTDNGLVAAHRTPSRQQSQRERGHPGSDLSSPSGSAIKRIRAGVKARPSQRLPRLDQVAGLHPPVKISCRTKKEYRFLTISAEPRSNCNISRYIGPLRDPPSHFRKRAFRQKSRASSQATPPNRGKRLR